MKQEIIDKTLKVTSNLMYDRQWSGACYATSAIHHILLTEQGVTNTPMLGVTQVGSSRFDHAWIEIDDHIYDIAVSMPQENANFFEIFGKDGIRGDIESQCLYTNEDDIQILYGFKDNVEEDVLINLADFGTFMTKSPFFNKTIDYWELTIQLGNKLNLSLNRDDLIERYSKTKWNLI